MASKEFERALIHRLDRIISLLEQRDGRKESGREKN
jgi:hypothetical protein